MMRQFISCDVDIVGSTVKDDAEILSLVNNILKSLKIEGVIFVNNRKLLNEILKTEKIEEKYFEEVIREIDKLDKLSSKEVYDNLKKYNAENLVKIFNKEEKYFERYESYNEIKELREYCNNYSVKFEFMPSLARGLSYYTGTVFEIKTKNIKETIFGGGSYNFDGIQGVGFGVSIERLELDYANSYKIQKVIFVGKKEVEKKQMIVKDMKTGKQIIFKIKESSKLK